MMKLILIAIKSAWSAARDYAAACREINRVVAQCDKLAPREKPENIEKAKKVARETTVSFPEALAAIKREERP